MPADPVAIAILVVLAIVAAPLTADWRRRLATRRFDAVYERNLLRRTGRGSLVRFGQPDAPAYQLAAADPETAPALPSALEPALRELCEGLGWSVVRLVEDALPALDPVRRRVPGADDEGAFLAWVYTLAVDEALDRLAARGLLTPPAAAVTVVRVTDPSLAGAAL